MQATSHMQQCTPSKLLQHVLDQAIVLGVAIVAPLHLAVRPHSTAHSDIMLDHTQHKYSQQEHNHAKQQNPQHTQ